MAHTGPYDLEYMAGSESQHATFLARADFSSLSLIPVGDTLPAGSVLVHVCVRVIEAFAEGATITVGEGRFPERFLATDSVDLTQPGVYCADILYLFPSSGQIRVTIGGAGSTGGSGTITALLTGI